MVNLVELKSQFEQQMSQLLATHAYRPNNSQLVSFYNEVFAFMKTIRKESVEVALQSEVRVNIVEDNIRNFLSRINMQYSHYRDVLFPIQSYLMLIMISFGQVKHQLSKVSDGVAQSWIDIFSLPDQLSCESVVSSVTTVAGMRYQDKDQVTTKLVVNELSKFVAKKLDQASC